jgi:hypothetical protein
MKRLFTIYFLLGMSAIAYSQNGVKVTSPFGTFTQVPKEMIGCGSSYFLSMGDRKATKYIGVDDGAKYGLFKIGNKLERFTEVKFISIIPQKKWTSIYQNQSKSIILTIEVKNQKPTGDEDGFITGTITIEINGKKTIIPFVGDNGC